MFPHVRKPTFHYEFAIIFAYYIQRVEDPPQPSVCNELVERAYFSQITQLECVCYYIISFCTNRMC